MPGKDETFKGVIGRTIEESVPDWPEPASPRAGSPNVVFILLDDTGFGHFGCYGSDVDTPNFDRLAENGIRYSNFHTTALCSPTRASLLTGRNHHAVGMRGLANFNTGFPNCRGRISKQATTAAEILRDEGYSTIATGKWHLTQMEDTSPAGPFDQWPLARGFDKFYGFLQGETHQFCPELFCGNEPVDPPKTPEEGYHLTEDIVDRSIGYIRDQHSSVPEKPFFLYMCFGATHAPHHAPKAYIDKYKGRFDEGWDKMREKVLAKQKAMGVVPEDADLAPPNAGVQAWDSLSDDEKRLFLRHQEAFAGMLDHTDHHVGRLVDFLQDIDQLDNTLIFLLSDNGAEGGGGPIGVMDTMRGFNRMPESFEESLARIDEIGTATANNNYPSGWAQAGNTPLKRYKKFTHGGGVRDPLIVHWPAGLTDKGAVRLQFHHVSDLVPTVLELLDIEAPPVFQGIPQVPIQGTSLAYTFASEHADAPSRKDTQYFEMAGNRGIWHKGWKAVAYHEPYSNFDDDDWELYNLDMDFSECHNLAKSHPQKLREMVQRWWVEAGKYDVLPLDDRMTELFRAVPRTFSPSNRRQYVYYPPVSHLTSEASPVLGNRSWVLSVDVDPIDENTEGIMIASGGTTSGFVFYIRDQQVIFDYNLFSTHYRAESEKGAAVGKSKLGVRFERLDNACRATLLFDDEPDAVVEIPKILRVITALGTDIGRGGQSPVAGDYMGRFPFSGRIHRLKFDVPKFVSKQAEQEYLEAQADLENGRE